MPQLVEVFLGRYFRAGDRVYDPFAGCGTTLVEANVFGADAVGCDISAFNCLLARVKTARYSLGELELGLRGTLEEARRSRRSTRGASEWLQRWYAPQALAELLAYRRAALRLDPPYDDVARIVLSRAARSARLTTHFDLDFPREPVSAPYHCRKHKRECRPSRRRGSSSPVTRRTRSGACGHSRRRGACAASRSSTAMRGQCGSAARAA